MHFAMINGGLSHIRQTEAQERQMGIVGRDSGARDSGAGRGRRPCEDHATTGRQDSHRMYAG